MVFSTNRSSPNGLLGERPFGPSPFVVINILSFRKRNVVPDRIILIRSSYKKKKPICGSIDELQKVWQLASRLHDGQKYGGQEEGEKVEYLNHIGSVTFEILNAINEEQGMNADLAIKCAMLHDSIEDTEQSFEEVKELFGIEVANGVMALTKNEELDNKEKMMLDSLARIKEQPKEVWAVKMADRICNLYAPPFYWNNEKKIKYQKEAKLIYKELKEGNKYLAERLEGKIKDYDKYIKF